MIAIIDSGVGNIRSVANAFERLGVAFRVTKRAEDIAQASKIVFPGVGSFIDGMRAIKQSRLLPTLWEEVLKKKKPFLGICLGMQLLASEGFEDGKHQGLNFIPGVVRLINISSDKFKLPHIGWNNVYPESHALLFKNLPIEPTFYFVHSYIFEPRDKNAIVASCEYGEKFAASIQYKNIFGVQFHPEKSQRNGLQLLKNFVTLEL